MDYEDFKQEFQAALKDELAERGMNAELGFQRMEKMNDSYDAITVKPVDSIIGLNFNAEKAFENYKAGEDMDEVVNSAADSVVKGFREAPKIDVDAITDYEQMKGKLSMEVVSADRNEDLLQNVPHEKMEDMAVIYRLVLDQTNEGNGTVLVTDQLMEHFGITQEQLRQDALESAPEIRPSEIRGMSEVMREINPDITPEIPPEEEQMFVASVPDKIHGAGVIAYPNFMEDAAEKMGGDFYVLPSSIHEVLLVRDNGAITSNELENMVKDVNATQVEPEDRLTDHVYHYDSKNHIFEMADKFEQRQQAEEHEVSEDKQDKDSVLDDLKDKKQKVIKKEPAKDTVIKETHRNKDVSL
jgi:hypothetical protein